MRDVMEMGLSERTVTVNRIKLLETLKANRDKHQSDYHDSLAGYKEQAKDALAKKVERARQSIDDNAEIISRKIDKFDPEEPLANTVIVMQQISFQLEVPKDHTRSYDVAIQMAEWEVGETIELTQSQFQCFVMDDWDWKQKFEHLNKSYTNRM